MSLEPATAVRGITERFIAATGGPDQRRAVVFFTAVQSLASADAGSIGALAPYLETSFHIDNLQLGLLVTVSSLVGAVASIPIGALTDRSNRVRMLTIGVVTWSVAMIATGLAVNYAMLLVTRVALGAVTAVAGPTIPSLTGDLIRSSDRSRIYSYLLTGDLLGAGAGLLIAGNLGAALGWRITFFVLAAPSLVLAFLLHQRLPEPERVSDTGARSSQHDLDDPAMIVRRQIEQQGDVSPYETQVLRTDPTRMTIGQAARYVLTIRSNLLLIGVSALGYFFFAGLRTFAVIFARGRFGISQGLVSLLVIVVGAGAAAGTLAGGYISDRLIRRRISTARFLVSGVGFVAGVVVLIPGFVTSSLAVALPTFVVGAALVSGPNPALDAARLDVVPGRLWGRAEAVRTFLKAVLEAAAPLLFGVVSTVFGGRGANLGTGVGAAKDPVSPLAAAGISRAFLVMLAPLAVSGLLLLRWRRVYLRDVATASASRQSTSL
jgi:predicted MFS family arabinose efflux permease